MPQNRLMHEKSPYLLQHAHNPVDWLPWGSEAFEKARRENKPIFLSVGYSTCHWCHVMAHESFEDDATAEIMNREFVNIKVDREERPDVDRVYMTFVQATTGGGGWPMSVWLTPQLEPFVGGTYFPPEDRFGQPAFRRVLQRIAETWKSDHEKISKQGANIVEALREAASEESAAGEINASILEEAYHQFARTFDVHEGGFGRAPKFPRPVTLNFLTRFHARNPDIDPGQHALEMVLLTLQKMAAGGMHDHIGGGFHRYSVDGRWHVPHFEKMLYDQAQLASAYLDAFQITGDADFAATARDVLDYIRRDMTSPEGGFYSAEDADSPVVAGNGDPGHGKTAEGAFYVWTKQEIDDALGDEAPTFSFHYGVEENGNIPAGADPHGDLRGKNILIRDTGVASTAGGTLRGEPVGPTPKGLEVDKKDAETVRKSLAQSRQKLFSIRSKRPRPHLDDKIIAAWNGLMISAFARGAQVLDDASYLETATRAAEFVRAKLYDGSRKILFRSYRNGRSEIEGFADDYAFFIQGLIDLYQASFEMRWLKFALELQGQMDAFFWDDKGGGYFGVTGHDSSILLRMKEENDSAEPAPSSVAALNLARLAAIRNEPELLAPAKKTVNAFARQLMHFPSALPQMLVAVDFLETAPRQIVIAGDRGEEHVQELLGEVQKHFLPHAIVLLADGGEGQDFLCEKNEAIRAMGPVNGKPAVYICEDFTCKAPVTNVQQLRALL
ncbi:MAG: thioredoxin domain-containing protein [Verrucomicrobia bacterium]|nr:MAG: thioredoxin domain-containing protein [Verrucomicrobiota bacterium]